METAGKRKESGRGSSNVQKYGTWFLTPDSSLLLVAALPRYDNDSLVLRTLVVFVTFTYMSVVTGQGLTSIKELRQGGLEVVVLRRRKDLR